MTDHVQGTAKLLTDYVSDTENPNPRSHVSFYMDQDLYWEVKKYAFKRQIPIKDVVSEALATFLKWMKKAEVEEVNMERVEKTKEELRKAELLLQAIMRERRLTKLRKKKKPPSKFQIKHPGILTPQQMERRQRMRDRKERERLRMEMEVGDNHVPGTEN